LERLRLVVECHLNAVEQEDVASVGDDHQIRAVLALQEADRLDRFVLLRLNEAPRELEALRLLGDVGVPEAHYVINARRGQGVLVADVQGHNVLVVAAARLREIHCSVALCDLRLVEEGDTALPASGHEPEVAVLREKPHIADLGVEHHHAVCLVEDHLS